MLTIYSQQETTRLYILSEAEYKLNHNRRKAARRQRTERNYFIKQRLSGVVMLTMGIVTPFILKDATFSLFAVPIGSYLLASKERIIGGI